MIHGTRSLSPTASWAELGANSELPSARVELSAAERLVALQIRQGCSDKEIASALGKSVFTVKRQVNACLHKFGVPTRGRLIALLHTDATAAKAIAGVALPLST